MKDVNDLQTVVAGMFCRQQANTMPLRLFLNELAARDYERLIMLDSEGKVAYLQRGLQRHIACQIRRTAR